MAAFPGLANSVPAIGGGGAWGVLFATFSFFVAMIPFCGFRQIALAIGWQRMRALLFGDRRRKRPGTADRYAFSRGLSTLCPPSADHGPHGAALGMKVRDVFTQNRRLWVRLRSRSARWR